MNEKLMELLESFNSRLSRLEERTFDTDYDDYELLSELRQEMEAKLSDS